MVSIREVVSNMNVIEVIENTSMLMERMGIIKPAEGGRLVVYDPALGDGKGGNREGQLFVQMPSDLADVLPGSEVEMEDFLGALGLNDFELAQKLVGNFLSEGEPLIKLDEDGFRLKVYHGSANELTVQNAALAELNNFSDPESRAQYQKNLFGIMKSIILSESAADYVIREDCIASADSIMGVITAMQQEGMAQLTDKVVRIDVAAATPQGLLILRKFAHDNQLVLDIRVGFLSSSLSAGEPVKGLKVKIHANYLKKPPVGDMGDALKSLPEKYDSICGWNGYRHDKHGDRGLDALVKGGINGLGPKIILLKNGGLGMQAYYEYLEKLEGQKILLVAKRVYSPELGYGVLIDELVKNC